MRFRRGRGGVAVAERRGIGPKLRFEVFKRDNFTCRYCGRRTPEVVLEIDHVIPVSEGGSDDMENLVTSCWECNRGKGASVLSEDSPVSGLHEQTVLMLERELQLKEYEHVRRSIRERENRQIQELRDWWAREAMRLGMTQWEFPSDGQIRRYLRKLSAEEIKDAMEIAIERAGAYRGASYLIGILKNWAEDRPSL
jgi:hypothetical protein